MAEEGCVNCGCPFLKKKKGYKRYSLEKTRQKDGKNVRQVLSDILNVTLTPRKCSNTYICSDCKTPLSRASTKNEEAAAATSLLKVDRQFDSSLRSNSKDFI